MTMIDEALAVRYEVAMARLGKEPRPGQLALIELGLALTAGAVELVRAPTSTGKSLAALIIAGLRAVEKRQRTIISTYTKLLQNQYQVDDFDRARQLFPMVRFEVLKGADNYLCRIAARHGSSREYRELAQLWVDPGAEKLVPKGDPDEVVPGLEGARANWKMCKGHKYYECGYAAAKERARAADVVVANHALVLINGENPGVLGPHSLLIVDEIHNLPKAAESFGGAEIDLDALTVYLAANMGREGNDIGETLLRVLKPGSDKVVPNKTALAKVTEAWAEISPSVLAASEQAQEMHTWLTNAAWYYSARDEMTVMPVINKRNTFKGKEYHRVSYTPIDIAPTTARALESTLTIEKPQGEKETFSRAVLMMSATVGTPDKPTFVADRCGVSTHLTKVDSPIRYSENMRISVIERSDPEDVWQMVKQTRGRTLVLCRAWANRRNGVKEMCEYIFPRLAGKVNLYAQVKGDTTGNAEMVRRFTEDKDSILVGTASFNEGINVPGETLSQVIIVTLPKLMTYKNELETERQRRMGGIRPWTLAAQIPHTATVLEQQMGRLLRDVKDRGLVAIMDDYDAGKGWADLTVRQAARGMGGIPVVNRDRALAWFRAMPG